ncbi:MAG: hypothetical protein ACJASP_002138 [Roseivirga sp.]|jgi:hypothetical protein
MKSIKNILLVTLILLSPTLAVAQEPEMKSLTSANDSWGKEFFEFPLSFAPEIDLIGMEEARFPKGWGDQESPEFWSYAFAWEVEADQQISKVDLEKNLQFYFDGLLSIDVWQKNDANVQKTNPQLIVKAVSISNSSYTGKMEVFESRFTKKPMTFNVTIEQHYCKKTKKAIVLFKFSPKEFGHNTWLKLAEVELRKDLCK